MARNTLAKVDLEQAQELLDRGSSVRDVALHFECAPAAIYELVKRGRLRRPEAASA